jgi:hypothetical protein
MDATAVTGSGVGQRVIRKEDDRYLRGRGAFVADIRIAGMRDLAFARSPLAHARIRAITAPRGHERAVFTAATPTLRAIPTAGNDRRVIVAGRWYYTAWWHDRCIIRGNHYREAPCLIPQCCFTWSRAARSR